MCRRLPLTRLLEWLGSSHAGPSTEWARGGALGHVRTLHGVAATVAVSPTGDPTRHPSHNIGDGLCAGRVRISALVTSLTGVDAQELRPVPRQGLVFDGGVGVFAGVGQAGAITSSWRSRFCTATAARSPGATMAAPSMVMPFFSAAGEASQLAAM
jgi:hypothetical protein